MSTSRIQVAVPPHTPPAHHTKAATEDRVTGKNEEVLNGRNGRPVSLGGEINSAPETVWRSMVRSLLRRSQEPVSAVENSYYWEQADPPSTRNSGYVVEPEHGADSTRRHFHGTSPFYLGPYPAGPE